MAAEEDTMEKTRIYVGGLGEAVTGDDLHKVFSSLGIVGEVEIVRTKGRSFAYVDFVPTVSNSISKLFSTYNGCVWKGGKLKLEKAKEHYLAKLRKEWEEDVQVAATNPSMDVDATLEKPVKIDKKTDTRQLRLFIPRLGKVKPLPLSGTGKHKYSFRRVEARSVPLFFCDCKEHAGSCTAAEMQNQDENDGVMNEQEINTMNLVMKKLFEKENVPIVNNTNTMQAKEHNDLGSNNCQPLDTSESDEDNLIINVVSRRKNNFATSGTSEEKRMSTKRTRSDGIQASREESIHKEQKVLNKKMKQLSEERKMNEAVTAVPGGEEDLAHDEADADLGSDEDDLVINVLNKGNKRKARKEIVSSSQELRTSAIPKSEDEIVENAQKVRKKKDLPSKELRKSLPEGNEAGSNKSVEKQGPLNPSKESDSDFKARPSSQKSSWKALVGDKGISSFSLSSILANDMPIEKEPVPSEKKMGKNKMVVTSENPEEEGMSIEPKMPNNIESKNKMVVTCENPEEEPMSIEPKMDNNVESKNEMVTASENLEEPISVEPKMDNNIEMAASESLEGILGEKEKDNMAAVAQPTNNIDAGPSEYGRGSSWLHQSSWVQLVSDKSNAFSITDVLPVTAKEALVEVPISNYEYGMKPGENETNGKDATTLEAHSIAAGNHVDNDVASAPVIEKGDSSSSKKAAVGGDVKIGETCNFMRSAESLKEWSKLKAALSKSRNRKGNDK